jgi:hypothetical protein
VTVEIYVDPMDATSPSVVMTIVTVQMLVVMMVATGQTVSVVLRIAAASTN